MGESMSFWSMLLPADGKEIEQELESTATVLSTIHLTGLALGANPFSGPHVVALQYNGINTVLATLEAPHTRQVKLDVALDQTLKLRNLGGSEVYAYGFQVSTMVHESEDEEGEEEEDEDDEDDDDYDVDEEIAKTPRHLRKALALVADTPNSTDRMDTEDGDDESDEDEDEDEDESGDEVASEDEEDEDGIPRFEELHSDDMVGEADEDEEVSEEGEDDSEEGEEQDEDEEEEAPPAKVGTKRLPAQTPQPAKAAKIAKQEPPKSAPPKQQPKPDAAKGKPAAKQPPQQETKQAQPATKQAAKQIPVTAANGAAKPQNVPVTGDAKAAKAGKPAKEAKEQPQANGKAKEADGKEGKGAEAKGKKDGKGKEPKAKGHPSPASKGVVTPASEAEFRKALMEVISGGAVPLAQLGSAVKKPSDVTEKLGAYLKKHADIFEVKGDQVTLKKK